MRSWDLFVPWLADERGGSRATSLARGEAVANPKLGTDMSGRWRAESRRRLTFHGNWTRSVAANPGYEKSCP
jgi:hypothetical protein